jgi:hypothetical protein
VNVSNSSSGMLTPMYVKNVQLLIIVGSAPTIQHVQFVHQIEILQVVFVYARQG